jgi:hypothetical protein
MINPQPAKQFAIKRRMRLRNIAAQRALLTLDARQQFAAQ